MRAFWSRPFERGAEDSGQVLVLTALLMPVALIAVGLVIDYGGSLVLQRKAQASADAAALAAAWNLPVGWSAVQSSAASMLTANGAAGLTGTPTVTSASKYAPGDSVKVHVSGAWSTAFARVAGITSIGVSASATATVQSVAGCSATGCDVAPWGLPDCAVTDAGDDCSQPFRATLGQRVTLKTDDSVGGKFYGLAPPIVNGSNCSSATGAGDYSRAIIGKWASNGARTCNVKTTGPPSSGYSTSGCAYPNAPSMISCVVGVKSGNMVGPTASGLTSRLGCGSSGACNGDSLSRITGGCDPKTSFANFCPVVRDSPRLVVVPIVRNLDNSTGYASCSSGQTCQVKVVDLVYFYIDATYSQIQGNVVTGTFFRSTAPPAFDLVGPYNGGIFVRVGLSS